MVCILIVDHQFNRMHPWCSWEGMLPGRCSPDKKLSHLLEQEYRVVAHRVG